MQAEYFMS